MDWIECDTQHTHQILHESYFDLCWIQTIIPVLVHLLSREFDCIKNKVRYRIPKVAKFFTKSESSDGEAARGRKKEDNVSIWFVSPSSLDSDPIQEERRKRRKKKERKKKGRRKKEERRAKYYYHPFYYSTRNAISVTEGKVGKHQSIKKELCIRQKLTTEEERTEKSKENLVFSPLTFSPGHLVFFREKRKKEMEGMEGREIRKGRKNRKQKKCPEIVSRRRN